MIYLDYSATTPVLDEVLDTFVMATKKYPGNPNSLHKLGIEANNLIKAATEQIADILSVKNDEIIYTSGASESNNMTIKGIANLYKNRGNHIITTELEHSSIYGPLNYLTKQGFDIDFVKLNEDGQVNLDHLKTLISDRTILVSIASVNSELGIKQPITEIAKIVKNYPKCFFHSDMTQSIGKEVVNLENIDFISFTAHKFYGLKGIGCLIIKNKQPIEPLIHGGKSTSIYRSGTPTPALIASLSKALRLAVTNLNQKQEHIKNLNNLIRNNINENIKINSPITAIPHILNISVVGIKPETFQHALEEHDIYVSTQTACSTGTISKAVLAVTNNEEQAKSSIRISISHLTSEEEILKFIEICNQTYQKLRFKNENH